MGKVWMVPPQRCARIRRQDTGCSTEHYKSQQSCAFNCAYWLWI